MNVDPPQAAPRERLLLDEAEDFGVRRRRHLRQVGEQPKDFRATPQISERQLTDDEWVTTDLCFGQQAGETEILQPKVVDPDRRVGQDHGVELLWDRCRRTARICGSIWRSWRSFCGGRGAAPHPRRQRETARRSRT